MLKYLTMINKEELGLIIKMILKCYKKDLSKINFSKEEFVDEIKNFIKSV